MKIYMRPICFIFILLGAILVGCNSPGQNSTATEEASIDITHKLGVTKIVNKPSRIVVFDIGALETLHELGTKPAAVPKRYLPEYLSDIEHDESIVDIGSIMEPDFEAISGLNPDLILISTRQERHYGELSRIAPTVFIGTDNKDYLHSFIENTRLLAKIVGKEELAQEKLEVLEKKIQTSQDKFKNDPHKALFLLYNNGRFSAYGKESRFGFIYDVLHIKPALEYTIESVHGQRVSNELIGDINPDYLFIVDRNAAVLGNKANKNEIENVLIQQTSAYKNDKVFYLNPNIWFISGGGLTSVDLMVDDILTMLK